MFFSVLLLRWRFVLVIRSLLHTFFSREALRSAHDVSSAVYLNTGVVFGVVLGLVTVNGLERHEELRHTIEREAYGLRSVIRAGDVLPEGQQHVIQTAVHRYAADVVSSEWQDVAMITRHSEVHINRLWSSLVTMVRQDSVISVGEQLLFDKLSILEEARIERIGLMQEKIKPMVWVILIGGTAFLIIFLAAFDPLSKALHIVLFTSVAATIISLLMLIYYFDHPTNGAMMLDPAPYREVLNLTTLKP